MTYEYETLDRAFQEAALAPCVRPHIAHTTYGIDLARTYSMYARVSGEIAWPNGAPSADITFGLPADDEVNACAFTTAGVYVVGVNVALPSLFRRLFNALLSSPNAFGVIGDVRAESHRVMPFPLTPDFRSVASLDIVPHCHVRQAFADVLAELALELVVRHELQHILGGHVGFLNARFGISSITEMARPQPGIAEADLSQALELDADMMSALGTARALRKTVEQQMAPTGLDSTALALKGLLISLFAVTRLFEVEEYEPEAFRTWSHPPSVARNSRMSEWIADTLVPDSTVQRLIVGSCHNEVQMLSSLCSLGEKSVGKQLSTPERVREPRFELVHQVNLNNISAWRSISGSVRGYELVPIKGRAWQC